MYKTACPLTRVHPRTDELSLAIVPLRTQASWRARRNEDTTLIGLADIFFTGSKTRVNMVVDIINHQHNLRARRVL